MEILSSLPQIAKSWYNFAKGDVLTQQMMTERLAICESCPHKVMMSSAGQRLVKLIDPSATTFTCGLCGCPLAGLTAHKDNVCKDGRWKQFTLPESYY